jgi:hypothetical protein
MLVARTKRIGLLRLMLLNIPLFSHKGVFLSTWAAGRQTPAQLGQVAQLLNVERPTVSSRSGPSLIALYRDVFGLLLLELLPVELPIRGLELGELLLEMRFSLAVLDNLGTQLFVRRGQFHDPPSQDHVGLLAFGDIALELLNLPVELLQLSCRLAVVSFCIRLRGRSRRAFVKTPDFPAAVLVIGQSDADDRRAFTQLERLRPGGFSFSQQPQNQQQQKQSGSSYYQQLPLFPLVLEAQP